MMLDASRFSGAIATNIDRATVANAMLAAAEIRRRIRGKRYTPNAALTTLIKGSSTPLVDEALLFQAVTHQRIDGKTAFAGVIRRARGKGGDLADIATMLHEGASLPVTPAMRGLFYVLAQATQGKRDPATLTGRAAEIFAQLKGKGPIYPLKPGTTVIVIPPRPFLREVFEDKGLLAKMKTNWARASGEAVAGKKGT